MEIGELTADRIPEAVRLWTACGLTRPWNDPHHDAHRALDGSSSTILGCIEQDRLVGTAMVGHDGHRGWVYYLAVDPPSRRGGVGRVLMAAVEAWCRERGVPKVQLMIRDENDAARGFYAALGYTDQRTTVLGKFLDADLQLLKEQA